MNDLATDLAAIETAYRRAETLNLEADQMRMPWRCTNCRQLHTDNGYPCQANHCPDCEHR